MDQEKERQRRMRMLRRYQINSVLLKIPADEIVVMSCIPAHGDQTTDHVMKVPQSLVCAQTQNKLYGAAAMQDLLPW
jgi:ornithine carbamoyltransferase